MSEREVEFDVVAFFRREAPIELERLESIARLVASECDPVPGRPTPCDSSYAASLQATFGIFLPRNSGDAVRAREAPVAG